MSLTMSTSIPRTGSIGGGAPLLSVKVGGQEARGILFAVCHCVYAGFQWVIPRTQGEPQST